MFDLTNRHRPPGMAGYPANPPLLTGTAPAAVLSGYTSPAGLSGLAGGCVGCGEGLGATSLAVLSGVTDTAKRNWKPLLAVALLGGWWWKTKKK